MAKSTKNGQSKTNRRMRTLHLAVPESTISKIKRLAKADKRSLNFKAGDLLDKGLMAELAGNVPSPNTSR